MTSAHDPVLGRRIALDPRRFGSWCRCLAFLALLIAQTNLAAATLPEGIPDFSADVNHPQIQSLQSGNWSDPGTWVGGQVPTLNHVVRILPGHTVTIVNTSAVAYTIVIDGKLAFATAVNTRLTVTNLEVMAGSNGMGTPGVLEVGTAANPIAPTVTAEIVIADTPLGGGVPDPDQFGTGILVFGKMIVHGSVRTPTFVRLSVEPHAGDTTLTLSEAVSGWRVGDRLVLPDTRHIKQSEVPAGSWLHSVNQWEERTVQAVSADGKTLTLNTALQYDHLGARDLNNVLEFLPHVGNLTRNVIVRSANPSGTRGHVLNTHMSETDIRYALFRDLGRTTYLPLDPVTNHIGRYPVHMHHLAGPLPTPANGFQFTLFGNAIDGGSVETQFKWGIAIHGSHYGLIQDNVVYNYNGASIATEDGSESFNVFDHNFALRGMGEPTDAVSEARMAMGTEAVGFWFRGPNNYIRNNVAANFQNPTIEAAYGYAFQFRYLGLMEVPNFKGADTTGMMGPGQSTTKNGNNMPLLQFENNEAYGALQGGLTYWWVNTTDPQPFATAQESLIKDLKLWNIYNKGVYMYPGNKVTFDGLKIRGNFTALSLCCGNGMYFADYMAKNIVVRNSDIQGMAKGIVAPESGFGSDPNLFVQNSYLRNWSNVLVPTVGSVNGCWMDDKLVVFSNTRFDPAPGQPPAHLNMVRDVATAPECLAKLDQARVYAFNGDAADNFQVYHNDPNVLPRPPAGCTPTTRPGIVGLVCPIAPLAPVPTASLNAAPANITAGESILLTWSTADTITVSIDQGIGTVAASGTLLVSPTANTTYTLTATGASGSVTTTASVSVRQTPVLTWNTPTALVYGTALGAAQLNATTGVAGTFAYSPPAGTILGVGASWQLSVTFTPSNTSAYTTATATVNLAVLKATPIVTWPAPAAIVVGTPLGAAQLNATANVPGTFSYTPAAGTVPGVGSQTLSVTFNPNDTTNYGPATQTVSLTVTKATPTVTWNAPAAITYPAALSAAQLNATASVPGSFAYSDAVVGTVTAGTVLGAGARTLSVTFTPTDTSTYTTRTASVPLTVLKATPVVTWLPPASINAGIALGPTQLNATVASPPGTLVYSPGTGALLPVGPAQRLTVTFTPTDAANFATVSAAVPITVLALTSSNPVPVKIGTNIAGTFNDATGHSGQSHLVYAPNAGVWWLFTLSSAHDSLNDRTVQSYVSSGPDLATATWTAKTVSSTLGNTNGATSSVFAGGRSLGVALRTVGTTDYAHIYASAAFDGQNSSNGHLRAELGPTSIIWGAWNNPGAPNTASEWQGPLNSGNPPSAASTHSSWGNSIGISTGGFIHHFSVVMDQEVDCAVGRSTNADIAASWTNGFGTNTSPTGNTGTSPPWTTAVIDKTMTFECKALAFAPLASDVMLAVYSNGAVAQPNMTNLKYQRSGASGTWTNISGSTGGGEGNVFGSNVTINQNDWALVPVSTTAIYAFRRNATGTAITGVSYPGTGTTWSAMNGQTAPPAFGTGQAMKIGAANSPVSGGLFGATDGTNVWLFVINTDSANSILWTRFNGTSWTSWATVPGTNTGTQTRNFIAGYPKVANNQVGLVWTQTNGSNFDEWATSLSLSGGSTAPPSSGTMTAPANNAIVSGNSTTVSATAVPGGGTIAGVQFVLDGVALGAEDLTSPYSITWDTTTASNGTHFLAAIARDTNGGIGPTNTVTVTVNNDIVSPTVVMTAPAGGATLSSGASVTVSADASDDVGVLGVQFLLDGAPLLAEDTAAPYTVNWNTTGVPLGAHTLAARARDAVNHLTTSASVAVNVKSTPTITWNTPAGIAYGTALGATQLNASTGVAGTFVYTPAAGTVLKAGSQTLSVTFTPTVPANFTTATASVNITVTDAAPPVVTAPANVVLEATSILGAPHFFAASASDPVDGSIGAGCTPPSGSMFPFGVTLVTCTATDVNGNLGSSSFTVTVRDTTPPLVTVPATISVPATEIGGARGNVVGSVGSQNLAAFLAGGTASDLIDVAPLRLAPQVTVNGTPIDATAATLFGPGTTPVVFRFRDASGNTGTAVSAVTVTARIADEPTVVHTTSAGGGRLMTLQNPDGGWAFKVGSNACGGAYGTCGNTIGTIALGLLAAYTQTGDAALLTAAVSAGNGLVARYNAAPNRLPVSADIEFLSALARLTGNTLYQTVAQAWFQVEVNQFPSAADDIDDLIAWRDSQGIRTVAAWDAASHIRAAKAVGHADRALAAAVRIRDLEPLWKDTNPAHRWDQCGRAGCGPAGNVWAYDYTFIAMGSLLFAIHDLPGFDTEISEYRSFLIAQQDPAGSWDLGDTQITSFVVMGLAAAGGTSATAAIIQGAGFLLAHQTLLGGWPADGSGATSEYTEVDGEVLRAMAALFTTRVGANVSVAPAQLSTVTFSNVTASGITSVVAIDHAAVPNVVGGFEVVGELTYQVNTTAAISGSITVCLSVPWVTDPLAFAELRILHGENGVLVDRTILAPDQPAPDFALRRVCARTSSLSPFAIAVTVPDTSAPLVTVPSDATIDATGPLGATYSYTASAIDDVDGPIAARCEPATDATFPLGTTAVQCTATDAHGNTGAASFSVTVRDATPPAVTVPAAVTIDATGPPGAAYTYAASATDAVDGPLTPSCDPASGTTFPVGSTVVVCWAADRAGNIGSASFEVTVKPVKVNVAPVASSADYKIKSNAPLTGRLNATDADGDALTFQIVTDASRGRVVVDARTGAFTYTPNRNGEDTFTFRVTDGKLWSNLGEITVKVQEGKDDKDDKDDKKGKDDSDDRDDKKGKDDKEKDGKKR